MISGRNKKDRTNQDIEVEWTRHWSIVLSKRRAFKLLEQETQDARLAKWILDKKKCSKILEQRHGSYLDKAKLSEVLASWKPRGDFINQINQDQHKKPKLRTQQDNKGLLYFFWKCSYFVKWKEMVLLWLKKAWNCNFIMAKSFRISKTRSLLSKRKRQEALIRRSRYTHSEEKAG